MNYLISNVSDVDLYYLSNHLMESQEKSHKNARQFEYQTFQWKNWNYETLLETFLTRQRHRFEPLPTNFFVSKLSDDVIQDICDKLLEKNDKTALSCTCKKTYLAIQLEKRHQREFFQKQISQEEKEKIFQKNRLIRLIKSICVYFRIFESKYEVYFEDQPCFLIELEQGVLRLKIKMGTLESTNKHYEKEETIGSFVGTKKRAPTRVDPQMYKKVVSLVTFLTITLGYPIPNCSCEPISCFLAFPLKNFDQANFATFTNTNLTKRRQKLPFSQSTIDAIHHTLSIERFQITKQSQLNVAHLVKFLHCLMNYLFEQECEKRQKDEKVRKCQEKFIHRTTNESCYRQKDIIRLDQEHIYFDSSVTTTADKKSLLEIIRYIFGKEISFEFQ